MDYYIQNWQQKEDKMVMHIFTLLQYNSSFH